MTIYVVRNREGLFFHPQQGFGGCGGTWVPEFERARLYSKLGMAKRQVTLWFGHRPELGCPTILAWDLNDAWARVIDLEADTKAKVEKTKAADLKRERERNAHLAKCYTEERDKLTKRIEELSS